VELLHTASLQAFFLHDSSDSVATPRFASLAEFAIDTRRAIDPRRLPMHGTNLLRNRLVLADSSTGLSLPPRVEAAAGDLQDLAHLAYPEGLPVLLDEPELHFWSSAK
jgi:hypothetical protein